jgi:uncharacterized membrane protein
VSKLIALLFEEEELVQDILAAPSAAGMGTADATSPTLTVDPDPTIALSVMETIQQKAKEEGVKVEDAVVLFRNPEGQLKIKQFEELTAGKGAKRGVFWGLLAGLVLGGPVAGLLWGLGIGAVVGAATDHGIDNKFLRSVGEGLRLNHSAVLVLVKDEDAPGAIEYLQTFDTELHVTDFSEATQEAAEKAAENDGVANAVEGQFEIE